MTMETRFNEPYVALSVAVAILASYVALNIAHLVSETKGRAQSLWLGAGALAMGIGIWSMHFIGMLAFEMPGMTMAYDIPLMILSVAVAVAASALTLYLVSRPVVANGSIVAGGIAMAAAISGMHYIGMYSMRMQAIIVWNIWLVVASVFVALVASVGSLLILSRLRARAFRVDELIVAAAVMGLAISGMHYIGMFAATFVHDNSIALDPADLLVTAGLEIAVTCTAIAILALALGSSIAQRLWNARERRSDELLGRSEARFQRLVEAVTDYAIYIVDPEGRVSTWNSGAERLSGYREAEVLGRDAARFFATTENGGVKHRRIDLEVASREGHFESEQRCIRKDGAAYWASIVVAPLFDRNGALTGFSTVIRDVTAAREAAERLTRLNEELEVGVRERTQELTRRETQLRTIADSVPVMLAQVDRHGRLSFANATFCAAYGHARITVIGELISDILAKDADAASTRCIAQALSGEVATYERVSQHNGEKATYQFTYVPEFDEDGSPAGFVLVAADVSPFKAVEAELIKAREAAEVANETKSAFLANMSHEIRTPLGAVLGFAELLFNGEMPAPDRREAIEAIKRNGELLSNVINDILDLSKVESGRLEVERVTVPLAEVMKEIGSVLNLAASERGITLSVLSEGAVPNQISTDPLRLRQVLLNVVGNAIKFTSQGSVTVRVKLLADPGGTKLAFVVADTGAGIAPENVERLFTPFMQADPSMTRRYGGTGLGLALSRRLARALGGDVTLWESTPERGSTFVVTIDPGSSEELWFQSTIHVQAAPSSLPSATNRELTSLRVLLAEDSRDNRVLVERILTRAGAAVETASNGLEAVELASSGAFDLVLMDIQMPVMDGHEATRRLRKSGFAKPIIALTAHAMQEERQLVLKSGFDGHMTKPIDHRQLVQALAAYTVH